MRCVSFIETGVCLNKFDKSIQLFSKYFLYDFTFFYTKKLKT